MRFVLEVTQTYKTFIEVEADSPDEAEKFAYEIVIGKGGRTTVREHPHLREAHDHPGWTLKAKVKGSLPEGEVWMPPVPPLALNTRLTPTPRTKP